MHGPFRGGMGPAPATDREPNNYETGPPSATSGLVVFGRV